MKYRAAASIAVRRRRPREGAWIEIYNYLPVTKTT